MKDFGKRNSYGKNSYQGLEASFNREMISPESLRSLGFSSQDIPLLQSSYPSMLNQTTGTELNGLQCDQHATSSAMVYINDQANMPLGQQASGTTDDKVARKRQRDREYRERCKKAKMQMKENLEALAVQNQDLKKEKESSQRKDALMNQTLESLKEEIKQLRNDFNNMKYEHEKQNMLVQTPSSEILRKMEELNAQVRQLGAEVEKISEEQREIKEGQRHVNEKFEAIALECDQLRNKTNLKKQKSANTGIRRGLMFQILKAKENKAFSRAAELTSHYVNSLKCKTRRWKASVENCKGQRHVKEKLEAIELEREQLRKDTNIIIQKGANTEIRLAFMFQILKARENQDFTRAAELTQALRELIKRQNEKM